MSRILYCGDCPECWMDRCENVSIARCGHDNGHGKMLGIYRKTASEHEVEMLPPTWCPCGIYKEPPKQEASAIPAGGTAFERADAALAAALAAEEQKTYME